MNRITLDLWVGVFVAIGLGALLFLALKVGNLASANTGETYVLKANFDNIGGWSAGSAISGWMPSVT